MILVIGSMLNFIYLTIKLLSNKYTFGTQDAKIGIIYYAIIIIAILVVNYTV